MTTVFTPEHTSLDRIFEARSTYRIPAYQRPYSWQAVGRSDRDSQVIQMWEDLWRFFEDNRENKKEYFLGSMVIIEDREKLRTYEVIDGQQRLTTLLLLFAAMRCFLQDVGRTLEGKGADSNTGLWLSRAVQTLESFVYNEEGIGLAPVLKLKIERTVGANYNQILEAAIACQLDDRVAKLEKKHRDIAQRYFKNRDYFLSCLRSSFLPDAASGSARLDIRKFEDFFIFLRARVAIVLIKTTDFSTAYRIFEILNNRGLPLSNLDLLRNFVLEKLSDANIANPDERWERLESQYTFTEDFVARWTESLNAAQQKTSAFNDAQRIFDERYHDSPTERKIQSYYRDLESNLAWYTIITEEDQNIEDVGIRNAVRFVKLLGNERYSMNLLLSLFRARNYQGGTDAGIADFLRVYRSHALHSCLLGRFSSPRIYDAIRALNAGKEAEARSLFELGEKEKVRLAEFFDDKIEKNEYAKLLLAACVWQSEEEEQDVVVQRLIYERSTLEHIIPQDPALGTNWLTDFDDSFRADFTYRLGNMTLLTQSMNSANRNFDFTWKRQIYAKTKLPMTLKLAQEARLTKEYLEERHRDIVATLRRIFLA